VSATITGGRRRARGWVLATRGGGLSVRVRTRSCLVGAVLLALILVVGLVTLSTGDYRVPLSEVVPAVFGRGGGAARFVVTTLREPRLLTGLLVGAALAVGGATFQSVSRNALGSPDIVGFDTGAATGALLVILVAHGTMTQIAAGSVVGGVVTALLVYVFAMKRGVQGFRLILVGIGTAAMLSSVNAYLITRAEITDAQAAAVWLTGSLNGRGWEQVRPVAAAVAVLLPLAVLLGRYLRVLEFGDDTARGLGVDAERTRLAAVVVGVGLTAVATACAGPIGFVALAAPQVARRLTKVPGPNVLPSALTGALLLATSDLAAQRVFGGTELPVGVATGVVGGLYLAWLLAREWRRGRG
jgi:iron complex transport system permease protein